MKTFFNFFSSRLSLPSRLPLFLSLIFPLPLGPIGFLGPLNLFLFFALNFTLPFSFALPLVLNPQKVVDLTLSQGLKTKEINLLAQKSYFILEQTKSIYDLELKARFGYEYNKAENLSGLSNILDETKTLGFTLIKKTPTGSLLSVDYSELSQDSVLNPFIASARAPSESLKAVSLNLRQNLWQNYFGVSDRKVIESASLQINQAKENRLKNMEEVLLNNMVLFWNTYTYQEQLRLNVLAKEKYQLLISTVLRKERLGMVTPGELARLQAELESTQQRIVQSSELYLRSLEELLSVLRISEVFQQEVFFDVPKERPLVPGNLPEKKPEELRDLKISKAKQEGLRLRLESVENQTKPSVDFLMKAISTGVNRTRDGAISDLAAGSNPTYYVGLEFSMKLDSYLYKTQIGEAKQDLLIAENEFEILKDRNQNRLRETLRQVQAFYRLTESSQKIVEQREKVIKQVEEAYKQGRQPLVEVIRSYNDLFAAQLESARSIGNYHIALNSLAQARGELIKEEKENVK